MTVPLETIRRAPKVLLHDHLDGGLRPRTIVELAAETGYDGLPTTDADELAAWIRRGADRKSLELYLETFAHTVGVMQTAPAISRVAAECAEDLAADGVVYAEVRYAPELSTAGGLSLDEVVEATTDGFRVGMERAEAAGRPIIVRSLATAMRQADRALEIAQLALRHRDNGVVGFDIAGPEAGYPPGRFARRVPPPGPRQLPPDPPRRRGLRAAVDPRGPRPGRRAARPRRPDRRRHRGRCGAAGPSSAGWPRTSGTGGSRSSCARRRTSTPGSRASIADHPFDLLRRLRFRVTVNTDNRLMSGVTLSSELAALDAAFGIGLGEMEWLTLNAMKSAFLPFDERLRLIDEVIKPGYARLRREAAG